MEAINAIIDQIRTAPEEAREELKKRLLSLGAELGNSTVIEHLESVLKGELLEVQWELEEVIDDLKPKKEPEADPEPEPEPEDDPSTRPLRPSELKLVYDDPRGLRLYRSTVDDRWVVSQIDPRLGQPVTYEVPGPEARQLRVQLAGSPYWLEGGET